MTASTELNEAFNPATEEGSPELTLLPKGAYLAEIEDAIIKPYKSGRGQAVNLTWSIMDEKYGGRRVWQRCTLSHESEQAMKIGRSSSRITSPTVYQPHLQILFMPLWTTTTSYWPQSGAALRSLM
jgi:hypothetical protein